VKHAGASQAVVALAWFEDEFRIEVRDNGKGFPQPVSENETGRQSDLPRSLGLPTIRHQLRLFGGSLEIHSEPGAGTRVVLIVPSIVVQGDTA
jgi:signal transduction histidine kinase